MAIQDFVSGRGWDVDRPQRDGILLVGDTLIIGWLGGEHMLLQIRRGGATFLEGRAVFKQTQLGGVIGGTIGGAIGNFPIRLSRTGAGVLQIMITIAGGGGSTNGGGTSSGPGGN